MCDPPCSDVDEAIAMLDRILIVLSLVVLLVISLSVFNLDITSSITSFYTIGIALSFIFKQAASNMFDSIIFLFVTHPYDTGDRIFVGAETLIVKKMGLMSTLFTRWDGTEIYIFNSILCNDMITNVRRSGDVSISFFTRSYVVKLTLD